MAMRALDGAVLVRHAPVVAAGLHAVMRAERIVAPRQVLRRRLAEVAEGRREAVAAMLQRSAAERPEGILQALGERNVALAAQHDMGMLEARIGQPEMVEPVIQRLAGNGDGQVAHVGEVRQPEPAGLVRLAEDHLLLGPMQRPPGADPPLQRPPGPGAEFGMPPAHLLEEGDRPQPGRGPQQRHDLAVPDSRQRVWSAPLPRRRPL